MKKETVKSICSLNWTRIQNLKNKICLVEYILRKYRFNFGPIVRGLDFSSKIKPQMCLRNESDNKVKSVSCCCQLKQTNKQTNKQANIQTKVFMFTFINFGLIVKGLNFSSKMKPQMCLRKQSDDKVKSVSCWDLNGVRLDQSTGI